MIDACSFNHTLVYPMNDLTKDFFFSQCCWKRSDGCQLCTKPQNFRPVPIQSICRRFELKQRSVCKQSCPPPPPTGHGHTDVGNGLDDKMISKVIGKYESDQAIYLINSLEVFI